MGTKRNPGDYDCYERALPDEPYFVLLARDPTAAMFIRDWAAQRTEDIRAGRQPTSDTTVVDEAKSLADNMVNWRRRNIGAWRFRLEE